MQAAFSFVATAPRRRRLEAGNAAGKSDMYHRKLKRLRMAVDAVVGGGDTEATEAMVPLCPLEGPGATR